MKLSKLDSIEGISKTHKLLQQDLIRPEVYTSLKQYILSKFRPIEEISFYMDKLEDGRKTVSFYVTWEDYKSYKQALRELKRARKESEKVTNEG